MSDTDNDTQEQKPQTSKWAKASMYSALIGLALILSSYLFYNLLFNALEFISYISMGVGFILIIFGFVCGVIGLICIRFSKTKLKGAGFAISGIIISLIPILFFVFEAYSLYMAVLYEKPYDDSNPEAVIAKVEKVCGFNFPEKIDFLKTAEKIPSGIDPTYAFIARFTTDKDGFAELRKSLSKAEGDYYSEEISEELVGEDGKSFTYGSRANEKMGSLWQKNAPQWFDIEIPKGRIYEISPFIKMTQLYFICVELPDSNDIVVNIEGVCINRKLVPKLINPENFNDLNLKDE